MKKSISSPEYAEKIRKVFKIGKTRTFTTTHEHNSTPLSLLHELTSHDPYIRPYAIVLRDVEVPKTWRQRLWSLMDDPGSSMLASWIATFIMWLIGVSVVAFILETVPDLHRRSESSWFIVEAVCMAFFTIEIMLRMGSCPNLGQYFTSFLNWVDIVAVVPFYVDLVLASDGSSSSSSIFRVLRLVRIFRVFKVTRYVSWLKIFYHVFRISSGPLSMILFVMCIMILLFSSFIYHLETDERNLTDHGEREFVSIPQAFWWCVVTMTTVGYGDIVPVTVGGRILAAITSLCGILTLAIPITVISATFKAEYDKREHLAAVNRESLMQDSNLLVEAYKKAYPQYWYANMPDACPVGGGEGENVEVEMDPSLDHNSVVHNASATTTTTTATTTNATTVHITSGHKDHEDEVEMTAIDDESLDDVSELDDDSGFVPAELRRTSTAWVRSYKSTLGDERTSRYEVDRLRLSVLKRFQKKASELVERNMEHLHKEIMALIDRHRENVEAQLTEMLDSMPVFVTKELDENELAIWKQHLMKVKRAWKGNGDDKPLVVPYDGPKFSCNPIKGRLTTQTLA